MTDIDYLFRELDKSKTDLLDKKISLEKEKDYPMIKKVIYNIKRSGNNILIEPENANNIISKYQETEIVVKLDNTSENTSFYNDNNGNSVIIYMGNPGEEWSDKKDNYTYKYHMIPSSDVKGYFYLRTNEILNKELIFGISNYIPFMIEVLSLENGNWISRTSVYTETEPKLIPIYKTNTKYNDIPDDITNAFIALDKLQEAIQNI